MPARVACPHCGSHFRTHDDPTGRPFECPSCGGPVVLPGSDAEAADREARRALRDWKRCGYADVSDAELDEASRRAGPSRPTGALWPRRVWTGVRLIVLEFFDSFLRLVRMSPADWAVASLILAALFFALAVAVLLPFSEQPGLVLAGAAAVLVVAWAGVGAFLYLFSGTGLAGPMEGLRAKAARLRWAGRYAQLRAAREAKERYERASRDYRRLSASSRTEAPLRREEAFEARPRGGPQRVPAAYQLDDPDQREPRPVQSGTDAPGVISLIFGIVSLAGVPLGCCGCGYVGVPLALIGAILGFFARGNLKVAGLTLNLLALGPGMVVMAMFIGCCGGLGGLLGIKSATSDPAPISRPATEPNRPAPGAREDEAPEAPAGKVESKTNPPRAPEKPSAAGVAFRVVEFWGAGQSVVIEPAHRNEKDLRAVGDEIHRGPRAAVVMVFDDEKAARMRRDVIADRLGAADLAYYEAHHVGNYNRHANGRASFAIYPDGSNGRQIDVEY